jgi:hypothetical protein
MALLIEAGQMTASDYVPIYPDLPLASEGASTEAIHAATMGGDRKLLIVRGRFACRSTKPRLAQS